MSVDISSQKLGKRIATYFPKDKQLRQRMALTTCLCVLGLWLLGRLLLIEPTANTLLNTVLGNGWLLASLVLLAGSIIAMANLWRHSARRVHLHQHGFVSEQLGELQSVFWTDICDIWQTPIYSNAGRGVEPVDWVIRIQALDGRKIKLSGFDGIRAVAHRAQDALSDRLFSNYQEAFRAGSWIRFGKKLAVSDVGLNVGMKAISWYEISDIFLDDEDGIRIGHCQERTKWIHIPMGSISNFQLLTRFLSWVKATQSLSLEDAERQVEENRSVGLFDHHGRSGNDDGVHEWDVNELAASGFEWDEIDDVVTGDCTMDELLARGPRQRPRVPK